MEDHKISGSIRSSGSKGNLKFCLNFRPALTKSLRIQEHRFAQIKLVDKKMNVVFHKNNVGDCVHVRYNNYKKSAEIYLDQNEFNINATEQKKAVEFSVECGKSEVEFEFDPKAFLKASGKERVIKKIISREDKILAGFNPKSDWGVRFETKAEEQKRRNIIAVAKAKFDLLYGEINNGTN